jgi:hypothetical protein
MRAMNVLCLLAVTCLLHGAEGLVVSFTTRANSGTNDAGGTKHIADCWIENASGGFVRTIYYTSTSQGPYLRRWQLQSGGLGADTDANMGATISTYGLKTANWNMISRGSSARVAAGTYEIWMESTHSNNNDATTSASVATVNRNHFSFVVDGISRSATVTTNSPSNFAPVSYVYTGLAPINSNAVLSIITGQSTTFTVANHASVTVVPSGYQWRKGGTNIGGATAATYTIASAVVGDAGSYDCVVTYPNSYGLANAPTMTSNALSLAVSSGVVAITAASASPATTVVNPGAAVTLSTSIAPSSATAPAYAWFSNASNANSGGSPIGGATSATYSPSTATAGMTYYYCTVTAGGASRTTGTCAVTVRAAPGVTGPSSTTVAVGSAPSFSVSATDGGYPSLSYQWQLGSWTNVGTNSASYTPAAAVATDNGRLYRCRVTNASGAGVTTTSATATLTVIAPPTIAAVSNAIVSGSTAALTATAAAQGAAPTSYRWQSAPVGTSTWTDVSTGTGGTTASYTSAALAASIQYRCAAIVNGVRAYSVATTINVAVAQAPGISPDPPAGSTVTVGSTATFTAVISGVPTPTIQWQVDQGGGWANIPSATSASYTTASTTLAMDGWRYRVVAQNGSGTTTSGAATLTVHPATGTAGTAYVSFSTSPSGGGYAPKHVLAAWIQSGATTIATLGTWAAERKSSLVLWNSVHGSTDAVMGATRLSHATVANLTWTFNPATIPDGTYTLWLESADDNPGAIGSPSTSTVTGANRTSLSFTITGGIIAEVIGGGGGFSGVRIAGTRGPEAVAANGGPNQAGKVANCGSGGVFALILLTGGAMLVLTGWRRRS